MAIGPINYIQNVQNPFEGMDQAFANFANMRAQNEQRQYQNNLLAMKQAAAEAKAEAAARQQEDIENFINSIQNKTATARDYAIMMARYPQASEGVKRSWETLNKNQKEGQFKQMLAMDQAAHNDPVELEKMFTNTIDAAANSGNQEMASDYQEKLDLIQGKIPGVDKEKGLAIVKAKLRTGTFAIDPEYAKVVTAMEDERRKEEKQPLEVSKLGSEAIKSGVEARYAEQNAASDAEKKALGASTIKRKLELEKGRLDLGWANNRFSRMALDLSNRKNDIEKEVKNQDITKKKADMQLKVSEVVEGHLANANMAQMALDSLKEARSSSDLPAYYGELGGVPGTALIKGAATVMGPSIDYETKLRTIKSQVAKAAQTIAKRDPGSTSNFDVENAINILGEIYDSKQSFTEALRKYGKAEGYLQNVVDKETIRAANKSKLMGIKPEKSKEDEGKKIQTSLDNYNLLQSINNKRK